jgi:hypothetical protein
MSVVAVLEALPAEELAEEVVDYTFQGVPPSRVRGYPMESLVGWRSREVIANQDRTWTVRRTLRPFSEDEMAAYLARKRGQDTQVVIDQLREGRVPVSVEALSARKQWCLERYNHRREMRALAQIPGAEPHWHGYVVHHRHPGYRHDVSEGRSERLVLAHRRRDESG